MTFPTPIRVAVPLSAAADWPVSRTNRGPNSSGKRPRATQYAPVFGEHNRSLRACRHADNRATVSRHD